jgi:hypothetical protein
MNFEKILPNQSILDIALCNTGSLESLFDILHLNNMLSLDLQEGVELKLPNVVNSKIVDYYKTNNIQFATGVSDDFYQGDFNTDFNNDFNI